ncbi:PAS domain-containing protein [Mesorhizobium sp. CAU 1741]|uniref:PAS domain-containing protein n=1 Tax=Mesorhizobium sp. CAU 1741 TaxID=3140366 RepID=UPI00325B796C
MKQDGSIALFQYWNRLRNGRPAPRRTEIEPADIKTLLADTFILEKDTRGEAVFRLAGTRLCATYGRELKGYSFPLIWHQRDQRIIARQAHGTFHDKSVVVVTYEGLSQGGKSNFFEMVLLPLEGGVGSPRLLGAITPFSKPYWLGADPIAEGKIETLRLVDADREPLFLANRVPSMVPSSSHIINDGLDVGEGGRRIRHLVVFEGGKGG